MRPSIESISIAYFKYINLISLIYGFMGIKFIQTLYFSDSKNTNNLQTSNIVLQLCRKKAVKKAG